MDLFSYLLGKKAGGEKGTTVVANPELVGDEDNLSSLQVGSTKYKVTTAEANPTLAGTESNLEGLEVDGTKFKIDTKEHYSTDEHVVGTWINGKPLYQKCFTGTMTSTNRMAIILESEISTALDKICYLGGIIEDEDVSGHPIPYWKGSNDYTGVFISGVGSDVVLDCGSQHGFGDFVLTIKYTKTTD